jgi:hypothetical protein
MYLSKIYIKNFLVLYLLNLDGNYIFSALKRFLFTYIDKKM